VALGASKLVKYLKCDGCKAFSTNLYVQVYSSLVSQISFVSNLVNYLKCDGCEAFATNLFHQVYNSQFSLVF
jgi:hypothetical protein